MTKPRVLLLSDVRGWAFDQNLRDMAEYCSHKFDFEIAYVAEFIQHYGAAPNFSSFDVVFCPYHRWGIDNMLPWDRTLGSLRAQWMLPEKKRAPQQEEFDIARKYVAFHMVNKNNYDEYIKACSNVVYLTNPVNMRRFAEPTAVRDKIVASWNGNARHDNMAREDVKGFVSVVQPACAKANVPLVVAEYNTCRWPCSEMPKFYQQANVSLCASLYEGASSSVMEGMASGLAVVATDVGNHREMMEEQLKDFGETGILLIERGVDSFARALTSLRANPKLVVRMGEINRASVQKAWSWDVWADRFVEFFYTPLKKKEVRDASASW